MALREDIAKLDHYIEQMDFLYNYRIEDKESLDEKRRKIKIEEGDLIAQRRKLYSAKRQALRNNDNQGIAIAKRQISAVSHKIRELRKQIALCDEVKISSDRVAEGVDAPKMVPIKEKTDGIRNLTKRAL